MASPPGRPCFPHLHLKHRLPATLLPEVLYELSLAATNEMDMWDQLDTVDWGNALPVLQLAVLHPHAHAVATPIAPPAAASTAAAASAGSASAAATSTPAAPSASALLPAPPSQTPAAAALKLCNVASRLAPDCKPLLSRGGKGVLRFLLSPSPALLPRQLALYAPGAPLSQPFYLHVSVPGPLGARILPALSGPHQLVAPSPRVAGKAGAAAAAGAAGGNETNVSGTVGSDKLTYVMGEHGVHHAFFVPLDTVAAAATGKGGVPAASVSVFSLPASLSSHSAPPAFIRFKEILGVNLGGRIWDCGLLLFDWLRTSVLRTNPNFFHNRKILEVGSGTGLVGIWIWAYVMLRNRQQAALAHSRRPGAAAAAGQPALLSSSTSCPSLAATTTELLLTDQAEAMSNLHENVATNLALLAGGQTTCDGVTVRASQLSWGDAGGPLRAGHSADGGETLRPHHRQRRGVQPHLLRPAPRHAGLRLLARGERHGGAAGLPAARL